jgi:hypothetical protein
MSHTLKVGLKPALFQAGVFLRKVRPRGPWCITAIKPDVKGAIRTATFTDEESGTMTAFIGEWNVRGFNIYFCANVTKTRMHRKPKKEHIGFFQYVPADLDPTDDQTPQGHQAAVIEAANDWPFKPYLLWSTGNGMQAFFRVRPTVDLLYLPKSMPYNTRRSQWPQRASLVAKCKRANKAMIHLLGGDGVQSIDHIFRVAHTINWPNEKKRQANRVPCMAGEFVIHNPDATYTLEQMPQPKHVSRVTARGLEEPPGGWDQEINVACAIMYCQNTKDLAAPDKSGTAIRTALVMRDWGLSPEAALEVMEKYWLPRCSWQFDNDELEDKINRSYASHAQNDPGCRTFAYRQTEAALDFKE